MEVVHQDHPTPGVHHSDYPDASLGAVPNHRLQEVHQDSPRSALALARDSSLTMFKMIIGVYLDFSIQVHGAYKPP